MPALAGARLPSLNRDTAVVKAVYGLYLFGWSVFHPLLSLTLEDKGLSKTDIGLVIAGYSLCRVVVGPLWAELLDRFSHHAASIFLFSTLLCGAASVLYIHSQPPVAVAFIFLYYLGETCHLPLIDTMTMGYLSKGSKGDWGQQRLYGSIAWGVGVPIAGFLYDMGGVGAESAASAAASGGVNDTSAPSRAHGQHSVTAYLPPYIMTAFFLVVAWLLTGRLQESFSKTPHEQAEHRTGGGGGGGSGFGAAVSFFLSPSNFAFLFVLVFITTGIVLVYSFVFLYLKAMDASASFIGVCVAFSVASEVPSFVVAGPLMRRIGVRGLIVVAGAAQAVRFFAYSLITEPWQALLVEPLHGLVYGLGWYATVAYVNGAAPKACRTSAMGLACGAAWGVGPLVGNALGGVVYDHAGGAALFQGYAALLAATVALWTFATVWAPRTFAVRAPAPSPGVEPPSDGAALAGALSRGEEEVEGGVEGDSGGGGGSAGGDVEMLAVSDRVDDTDVCWDSSGDGGGGGGAGGGGGGEDGGGMSMSHRLVPSGSCNDNVTKQACV